MWWRERLQGRYVLAVLTIATSGVAWATGTAWGGANAGGSVRLTWSADSNVAVVHAPLADSLVLYCRLDGTPELDGIGLELRWSPRARPRCFQQVNAPEWLDCGRVLIEEGTGEFSGDVYAHRIMFAPGARRDVIAFAFRVRDCGDAPVASFYVQDAIAQDASGAIDELDVLGAAHVEAGHLPLPIYEAPPHLLVSAHQSAWRSRWKGAGHEQLIFWPATVGEVPPSAVEAATVLQALADRLGITDWLQLQLESEFVGARAAHFVWHQQQGELRVYSGRASVHVSEAGMPFVVGSHFYDVPMLAQSPTVSAAEAVEAARGELGSPSEEAVETELQIYPGARPEDAALAWKVDFSEWRFFVSALDGRILGADHTVLESEPAQIWVPNPMAVLDDPSLRSTGNDDCQGTTYDSTYEIVTLRPDLVQVDGVTQLESPRAKAVHYNGSNPPIPAGEFIFERCDPSKGFEWVMGFYYLDEAQHYVHNVLGLPFNQEAAGCRRHWLLIAVHNDRRRHHLGPTSRLRGR